MKAATATSGKESLARRVTLVVRRHLARRRYSVAVVGVALLAAFTGLGYLGGGHPLAAAAELQPECEAYDALVQSCFPRRVKGADGHHRTLASKEICVARTNQLKAVCR